MEKAVIRHIIRQCPACNFRFPVLAGRPEGELCPLCGTATVVAVSPYAELPAAAAEPSGYRIEVLLDNIRSTYNVGSIFRSAEGCGVKHIHLCGLTPDPSHHKIKKTALGAEKTVRWSSSRNALSKAAELKKSGHTLWALEGGPASVPLFGNVPVNPELKPVLVIGNEISGIDPEVIDLCEKTFRLPMQGGKTSLNAAVAFGIAAYYLSFGITAL